MPVITHKKAEPIELVPTLKKYFQEKLAAELGPHDVKHLLDSQDRKIVLLDVRSKDGFTKGHLPGAVNIPLDELPRRMGELDRGKETIAYCWSVSCLLCTKAAYFLSSRGFIAREMIGGIQSWQEAGFPLEK